MIVHVHFWSYSYMIILYQVGKLRGNATGETLRRAPDQSSGLLRHLEEWPRTYLGMKMTQETLFVAISQFINLFYLHQT